MSDDETCRCGRIAGRVADCPTCGDRDEAYNGAWTNLIASVREYARATAEGRGQDAATAFNRVKIGMAALTDAAEERTDAEAMLDAIEAAYRSYMSGDPVETGSAIMGLDFLLRKHGRLPAKP